jgi:hypothetical protein
VASSSRSKTGSTVIPAAARPKPCSKNSSGLGCSISVEDVRYSVLRDLVDTGVWGRVSRRRADRHFRYRGGLVEVAPPRAGPALGLRRVGSRGCAVAAGAS